MDVPFDVTKVQLETERLILRPWKETDLDDMFAYASVPGVGEMAGWPHHQTIDTSREILSMFLAEKECFALYHKTDKKVIGSLGVHHSWANDEPGYEHLKMKNLGYVLAKDYWGQGLVPEALSAVIDYGFMQLGLDAFTIEHFKSNPQSRRVIEKCGFKYLRDGTYHAKQLDKHFEEMKYILHKEV